MYKIFRTNIVVRTDYGQTKQSIEKPNDHSVYSIKDDHILKVHGKKISHADGIYHKSAHQAVWWRPDKRFDKPFCKVLDLFAAKTSNRDVHSRRQMMDREVRACAEIPIPNPTDRICVFFYCIQPCTAKINVRD